MEKEEPFSIINAEQDVNSSADSQFVKIQELKCSDVLQLYPEAILENAIEGVSKYSSNALTEIDVPDNFAGDPIGISVEDTEPIEIIATDNFSQPRNNIHPLQVQIIKQLVSKSPLQNSSKEDPESLGHIGNVSSEHQLTSDMNTIILIPDAAVRELTPSVQPFEIQKLESEIPTQSNIEDKVALISYFYTCPECSLVFESEELLQCHEEGCYSECSMNFSTNTDFGNIIEKDSHPTNKYKVQQDLYKLAQKRIVRVCLENIGTRIMDCDVCGMSVPILELSRHQRTHEDVDSSDSDTPSRPSRKRSRGSSTPKTNPLFSTSRLKSKPQFKKDRSRRHPSLKSSVRLKMEVEVTSKPHQCRFCDKRFVSSSQCKSHENAHSEILTNSGEDSALVDLTTVNSSPVNSRKRGRPRKANNNNAHLVPVPDEKMVQSCRKCSEHPIRPCICKSQQDDSYVKDMVTTVGTVQLSIHENVQVSSHYHLQDMPVLTPKLDLGEDDDWSMDADNSNLEPPDLEPEECEKKYAPNYLGEVKVESVDDRMDKCQTCGEEIWRSALLDHIRSHLTKNQRECSLCEYRGHTLKDLKEHINKHYNLRPYECRFCDKTFSWETGLKRHLISSHEDMTPYKCSQCTLRFETHRERRRHELTHKNILKPGGLNARNSRRLSLNPSQFSGDIVDEFPRRRSFSLTTSTTFDNEKFKKESDVEQRKRSFDQSPEFAHNPIAESNVSHSVFNAQANGNLRNELQPREIQECNEESQSHNFQQALGSIRIFEHVNINKSNEYSKGKSEIGFRDFNPLSSQTRFPLSPGISNSSELHDFNTSKTDQMENLFNDVIRGNSSDAIFDAQQDHTSTLVSTEMYHEKPDTREYEKCKTCGMKVPIDDLSNHIQSHLRPNQKKCDVCSYEATSSKLLPEHMNIHYVLKPFQCNICKRRFAMKGYLRSHHQQVHQSTNTRRYLCHFCEKRFVRPCHRKAHEKGVHLREGSALPNDPEIRNDPTEKIQLKERKDSSKRGNCSSSNPTVDLDLPSGAPIPVYPTPHVHPNQDNILNTWSNANQPVVEYASQNVSHSLTANYPNHEQLQSHIGINQSAYTMQVQHQHQHPHLYSIPGPSTCSNLNQDIKPNINWSDFQGRGLAQPNEFDLKGADLNPHQYINTQHNLQGPQMQDFNYLGNTSEFNYQGYNSTGIVQQGEYPYSTNVGQNRGWVGEHGQGHGGGLLAPTESLAVNYGSYNPSLDVNASCDNNIIAPDARWSTDPFGILQHQNDQSVLHENTYTISTPSNSAVDLWTELRHEELKLFPENGYRSYSQHQQSGSLMGMSQQQGMVPDRSSIVGSEVVPLIGPSRTLMSDLLESSDGYTNGYFEGIPEISPDNTNESNVDGITDALFDDIPDYTRDTSFSAPLGEGPERSCKLPCRTCGETFLKADLLTHVRSHLTKGQKTCDVCQHMFCSTVALRDHMGTHYPTKKAHQCLTCFKYFSTKHSLKNHIVCIHEGKREAKCQICSRAFTLVFSLRRHMRLVHQINPKNGLKLAPPLIPTRGQIKRGRGGSKKKLEQTGGVGEDNGTTLDEGTRSELHRKILERSWTVILIDVGRDKIECGYCHESVLVKNLVNHRTNHTDPCHICGKPVRIDDMLHHGITHVKSLYCEICSWQARTRSQLWEHFNVHLGLKPVKCNICGAAFASRTSLRTHFLARHTKFRPHKCSYCDRSFVQLSVRRLHEMTHFGTKCPICLEDFQRKKDLCVHMKENHMDDEFLARQSNSRITELKY